MITDVQLTSHERRRLIDSKIRDMILRGKSRQVCLRAIADESKKLGFENTESHCSNIYHEIKYSLKREIDEIREEVEQELLQKLYYLYEKNVDKDDLKEGRECLREIAKLCGLSNGNQVNIAKTNTGDEIINISFS